MRAADYDHTETVASEVEVLNRNTALHRAEFSRQRADGTEINHLSVTYIITRGADGFRISALLFVLLIAIVWFARPAQGGSTSAAAGAH